VSLFVIVREDGQYAAEPGAEHSYTRKLEEAWTFTSRDKAWPHALRNESVRDVREILRRPLS